MGRTSSDLLLRLNTTTPFLSNIQETVPAAPKFPLKIMRIRIVMNKP
jgi:hypothetical protein